MPRSVQGLDFPAAEQDVLPGTRKLAVDPERFHFRPIPVCRRDCIVAGLDEFGVQSVGNGLQSYPALQLGAPARVIVMAMRDEKVLYPVRIDAAFPDIFEKLLRRPAAPGIHERGFLPELYKINGRVFGRCEISAADLENLARDFHGKPPLTKARNRNRPAGH